MALHPVLTKNPHYATLLVVFVLSSCGFHLRGSQPDLESDISRLYLTETAASAVSNEVRSQLALAGTLVTPTSDQAEFSLHLNNQSIQRSILSINPATGKVDEYQLTFTVSMSITDADSNDLVSSQVIRLVRDFAFDQDAVLGSVSEQRVLEEEMTRQAATQIIRRLNAVSRN